MRKACRRKSLPIALKLIVLTSAHLSGASMRRALMLWTDWLASLVCKRPTC